jgi:tRNA dimethylallyltransferase
METRPLVVIVGPTASGKTALAIELAEQFNGEIICADSRTVYKGMDIGTAKPTKKEQSKVPHWGIDIVDPDQRFTAADFKKYVLQKIAEIRSRGHVPFLVGGSGLYVDSVIFDYEFGDEADENLRRKLNTMTVDELKNYCIINNIVLPENHKNQRYLIRKIELNGVQPKRNNQPINDIIVVGISTDKIELRKKN